MECLQISDVHRETLWNQLPMSPEMITVAETMVDGRSPTQLQIAVPKALHYTNYSGDMLIREPIGTGKDLAILLPVLDRELRLPKVVRHQGIATPAVVFIVPSYVLAPQLYNIIANALQLLKDIPNCRGLELFALDCYHYVEVDDLRKALALADPDIVISTPGRLRHMLHEGLITLAGARIVILSEADQFLIPDYKGQKWATEGTDPTKQRPIFSTLNPNANVVMIGTQEDFLQKVSVTTSVWENNHNHKAICLHDEGYPLSHISSDLQVFKMDDHAHFPPRYGLVLRNAMDNHFTERNVRRVIIFFHTIPELEDCRDQWLHSFEEEEFRLKVAKHTFVLHGNLSNQEIKDEYDGMMRSLSDESSWTFVFATDAMVHGIDVELDAVVHWKFAKSDPNVAPDYQEFCNRAGCVGRGNRGTWWGINLVMFDPSNDGPHAHYLADLIAESGLKVPQFLGDAALHFNRYLGKEMSGKEVLNKKVVPSWIAAAMEREQNAILASIPRLCPMLLSGQYCPLGEQCSELKICLDFAQSEPLQNRCKTWNCAKVHLYRTCQHIVKGENWRCRNHGRHDNHMVCFAHQNTTEKREWELRMKAIGNMKKHARELRMKAIERNM